LSTGNLPASGHLDLCYENDPDLLPVAEARRRIAAHTPCIEDRESLHLRAALNRVLAEDVVAPLNVPGHTNSAVDGYALAAADLPAGGEARLRIVAQAFAGKPYTGPVAPGQCVHIMTGAPMPESSDTVIMREHAQVDGEGAETWIRIAAGHRAGQNVRAAGEDLQKGSLALTRGTRLLAAELGLLASMGLPRVAVIRRPKVAFFSTGDELRSSGEPLAMGDV